MGNPAGREARTRARPLRTAGPIVAAVLGYLALRQIARSVADLAYCIAGSVAALVAVMTYRRARPVAGARAWLWSLTGLVVYVIGDWTWFAVTTALGRAPKVGVADVAYLLSVVCMLVGALQLVRRRLGDSHSDSLVDALSIAATLVLVLWTPVIQPTFAGAPLVEQVVLAAYPIGDLVVIAVTARVVVGRSTRSGAALLISLSAVTMLAADQAFALAQRHDWSLLNGPWIDVLFLLALAMWALAFGCRDLPTAATGAAVESGSISVARLALSGVALLAAPVTVVVDLASGERPQPFVLFATTATAVGAVLVRIRRLARASLATNRTLERAIEDLAAAGAAVDRQRAYFAELVEHATDAMITMDMEGVITGALGSTHEVYGRVPDAMVGLYCRDLIHTDDVPASLDAFRTVRNDPSRGAVFECRAVHSDGSIRWTSVRLVNRLVGSPIAGIVLNISDITARKRAENALSHQARHDALTGLGNRAMLEELLGVALQARRGAVGLVYLDLDRFKVVNDSLGHLAGDRLLQAIAARLTDHMRTGDTVARLGGDEFCVVLQSDDPDPVAMHERLERLGSRLLLAVREPVTIDGYEVVVGASIGIVVARPHETAADLLRHGDIALYAAKNAGKDCMRVYDEDMQRTASDRLELESDLRAAVDTGALRLMYQPIVDLGSGRISGFESLLRWTHPTRGPIGPDRFIPIAEESGLILPIGRWVIAEACRTAASWQAMTDDDLPVVVTVNVSAVQLRDEGLVPAVEQALADTLLPPDRLTIELTESVLVHDPVLAKSWLDAMRTLGVRIAIDDFGTGYSSLSYLREFQLDVLKLDRSFLYPTERDALRPALIRGVMDLGQALGLATVAEGVETQAHLEALVSTSCRYGQGYLFSRPVPPEEAFALLARGEPYPIPVASRQEWWSSPEVF